jgi:hypothetical protein
MTDKPSLPPNCEPLSPWDDQIGAWHEEERKHFPIADYGLGESTSCRSMLKSALAELRETPRKPPRRVEVRSSGSRNPVTH